MVKILVSKYHPMKIKNTREALYPLRAYTMSLDSKYSSGLGKKSIHRQKGPNGDNVGQQLKAFIYQNECSALRKDMSLFCISMIHDRIQPGNEEYVMQLQTLLILKDSLRSETVPHTYKVTTSSFHKRCGTNFNNLFLIYRVIGRRSDNSFLQIVRLRLISTFRILVFGDFRSS